MGDGRISEEELAAFHRTVGRLRALPADDPVRLQAEQVAASFARDGRQQRKRLRNQERSQAEAAVFGATATGAHDRREDAPLAVPETVAGGPGAYPRPRRCYVCKSPYRQADSFYHALCPACAADNTARRSLTTDLRGRRVLLTGGRVKIGFQLALMMLRDGAEVLVTSRFPHDTLRRFRAADGSDHWIDRLTVIAVDLRDPRQVIGLCAELTAAGEPLDILVNNAAQTVRRPPGSYAALTAGEGGPLPAAVIRAPGYRPMSALAGTGTEVPSAVRDVLDLAPADAGEGHATSAVLPQQGPGAGAVLDEAGLLPDLSPANSWSARIGELDPAELLETQLVNALAPALLADRLLPLLLASPHPRRYIVNVTAVEGRFAVRNKTCGHPHTNMAKAALNMLTRTSGPELAARGVHMCSVDTGWITDENPAPKKGRIAARGFRTPLDIVDGAARVYDPIVRGEAGDPVSGVFLKDYQEAEW
ncbi:SDR family NAD(P)-dependent oxidoreductase [Streptomyces sp. NPDC020917]|uniref:SDR family NAD(P)-dependent oxidoreductase n=1 Tax=Streptomyces sp. NPDC020917 TaxID=3365102 RepID=UPI003791E49B